MTATIAALEELAVSTHTRWHIFKKSGILNNISGKKVLDVGSGTGGLANVLAHQGAVMVCIDSYPGNVRTIEKNFPNIKAHVCDAHDLVPFADKSFDLVVCSAVIEHFPHPKAVLAEIHRVLKPGGHLYVSVDIKPKLSFWLRNLIIKSRRSRVSEDDPEVHKRTAFSDPKHFWFWDEHKIASHLSTLSFGKFNIIYGGGVLTNILDCALLWAEQLTRKGDEQNIADHSYRMQSPLVRFYARFGLPMIKALAKVENYSLDAFVCILSCTKDK